MEIIKEIIPLVRHNRPGLKMNATSITVHNTGNKNRSANAKMHGRYLQSTKNNVSWHFTVDDQNILQHIPVNEIAWHAGCTKGNRTSIGIEICMFNGIDTEKAEAKAIELIGHLMKMYDIKDVKKHQDWTGKYCPQVLLQEERWEEFYLACQKSLAEKENIIQNNVTHWAEPYYKKLRENNIIIHEKRFDDSLTRGEFFSVISQLI